MLACHGNHTPAVHALLASKKLDANFMNEDGDNALAFACCHGSPAVVQALVRDGRVDINQKDAVSTRWLCWFVALTRGCVNRTDRLLS